MQQNNHNNRPRRVFMVKRTLHPLQGAPGAKGKVQGCRGALSRKGSVGLSVRGFRRDRVSTRKKSRKCEKCVEMGVGGGRQGGQK